MEGKQHYQTIGVLMNIDLPAELIERVHQKAKLNRRMSDADVIRRALDSLDWFEQELVAIEEGISAWRAGEVQDFTEFDREFRHQNGIAFGD